MAASGRRMLAQAFFERVKVGGFHEVMRHPMDAARASVSDSNLRTQTGGAGAKVALIDFDHLGHRQLTLIGRCRSVSADGSIAEIDRRDGSRVREPHC